MYKIGIDLGGTNIAVGLVNDEHKIVAKKTCPTGASRPAELITDDMARLCTEVCAENGLSLSDIGNIGVATPGIADGDAGCVVA